MTKSRALGAAVTLIDMVKGFLVAGIAGWALSVPFWAQALALLGAVLGHNYPVWLSFRGGRGLATMAGGMFAIGPAMTIVWVALWVIFFRLTKDILKANVAAVLLTPLALLIVPERWLMATMVCRTDATSYLQFAACASVVLLLSHLKPLLAMLRGTDPGDAPQ